MRSIATFSFETSWGQELPTFSGIYYKIARIVQIITYVDHRSFSDMGNNVVSKEVDNYRNSIVCGIRIKNSTNHKLECKHHYIYRGQIGYGPEGIGPKNTSGDVVFVGHQTHWNATGTTGVISWDIGSSGLMLVVLWSAPYNFYIYNNCYAVGIQQKGYIVDENAYKQMYNESFGTGSWFARKQINRAERDSKPLVFEKDVIKVMAEMEEKHKCHLTLSLSELQQDQVYNEI